VSEAGSKTIFAEVCSQKVEADGLTFLADTVRVQRIRNEEEYEGVRVLLEARLGNARIPLQIDVGFGALNFRPNEAAQALVLAKKNKGNHTVQPVPSGMP